MPKQAQSLHDELFDAAHEFDSGFLRQGKKENTQDYLRNLTVRLSELPDAEFNDLSEKAQGWIDKAVEAVNQGKTIVVPDGLGGGEAPAKGGRGRKAAAEEGETLTEEGDGEGGEAEADDPPAKSRAGRPAKAAGARGGAGKASRAAAEEAPARGRRKAVAPAEEKPVKGARVKLPKETKTKPPKEAKPPRRSDGERAPKGGFTTRSIRALVIKNPKITDEKIVEAAAKGGVEFELSTVRQIRRSTLTVIKLAQEAGRWVE